MIEGGSKAHDKALLRGANTDTTGPDVACLAATRGGRDDEARLVPVGAGPGCSTEDATGLAARSRT